MTYIFRPGGYNVTDAARATISQPGAAALPANGLLNNLIAYWPGNEAAGNALDLHINGLNLAQVNNPLSNPGLVYPLARQYVAASNQGHNIADNAWLSVGDIDFTLAAWVWLDSKPGIGVIAQKAFNVGIATSIEYSLVYVNFGVDQFYWTVSNSFIFGQMSATSFGSPALGAWYLLIGSHNSVADTINIQVNDGVMDSLAYAGGSFDSAFPFTIGKDDIVVWPFDGRIGPTMFWKSAPGLGGVLDAARRTSLYNAGAGLPYAAFTV